MPITAAATGVPYTLEDFVKIGERTWNLERLWNMKAGLTKADDSLPKRLLKEAHTSGPSAGVTMAVALVSAMTRRPVHKDVAMTGEITLRGKVLPVGAIRDKILAAHRAGSKRIIIPRDNENDLLDVREEVRRDLEFVLVDSVDEVLDAALHKEAIDDGPRVEQLVAGS
ncbi:MAG: hypothetical protein IIA90_04145 [Chloroflexi bacterium]|nr:hypothetical protein [Chloroflexota bacterium]